MPQIIAWLELMRNKNIDIYVDFSSTNLQQIKVSKTELSYDEKINTK